MTKTENNLKKNFIWNIIGLTLYGIVSLFLMIIVKHINGLKISGIFSYAYSICTQAVDASFNTDTKQGVFPACLYRG